ncbi:MAG TPA: MFS transporter, partial [Paraburkholderia sp.]|nr:MFS transporter [Paraburkholderia sp.]
MSMTPDAASVQATTPGSTHQWLPKVAIATSLVTGLEIFDLTVFGFFATMIGDQFFPAANPLMSLLLALGTFVVGFLMRPLGAMV